MFKKRKPPSAANAATAVIVADAKGIDRKKRRSISGSRRRDSLRIRPISATAERQKAATMLGDFQPRPGASMMPKVSVAKSTIMHT